MRLLTVAGLVGLAAAGAGCSTYTPAQSCQDICGELAECQSGIDGSTLAAGDGCQADCLARIDARGQACESSASYLADCFTTYGCQGAPTLCSDPASSFALDCE